MLVMIVYIIFILYEKILGEEDMKLYRYFLGAVIAAFNPIDATQLVYNMKVQRAFAPGFEGQDLGEEQSSRKRSRWALSVAPAVHTRERDIADQEIGLNVHEDTVIGGALLNLRYRPTRHLWWNVLTGVLKEHMTLNGTSNIDASRTGFDDVIFSGGYHMLPQEDLELVVYGLIGVPTRHHVCPFEFTNALVGTRFWSIGGGAEVAYLLMHEEDRSSYAIAQLRFIHFFDRSYFPVLPCNTRVQPGNVTDLLLTFQHHEGPNTFEGGYNLTAFTDRALIVDRQDVIRDRTVLRNSFYLGVSHISRNDCDPSKSITLGTGLSTAWENRFNMQSFSWWFVVSKTY